MSTFITSKTYYGYNTCIFYTRVTFDTRVLGFSSSSFMNDTTLIHYWKKISKLNSLVAYGAQVVHAVKFCQHEC